MSIPSRLQSPKSMRAFRILVVEDEERISNFLNAKLTAVGYQVLLAHDGAEALEQIQAQEPDMVLLDLILPKKDGLEVLKELRSFSAVPVIILSARGSGADRIKGLRLGADDYLPKPFDPDELIARIEAVKRRLESNAQHAGPDHIRIGNLSIDFKKRVATVSGRKVYLTHIEWLLLSEFSRNAGRLLTYEELLTKIWGPEYRDDIQLLRVWVSRLRRKLEKDHGKHTFISTLPKVGYLMDRPA